MCAEACGFNVLNVLCCQVVNVHYEFAAKDGLSTMPKIFFASTSKLVLEVYRVRAQISTC